MWGALEEDFQVSVQTRSCDDNNANQLLHRVALAKEGIPSKRLEDAGQHVTGATV